MSNLSLKIECWPQNNYKQKFNKISLMLIKSLINSCESWKRHFERCTFWLFFFLFFVILHQNTIFTPLWCEEEEVHKIIFLHEPLIFFLASSITIFSVGLLGPLKKTFFCPYLLLALHIHYTKLTFNAFINLNECLTNDYLCLI